MSKDEQSKIFTSLVYGNITQHNNFEHIWGGGHYYFTLDSVTDHFP